MPDRSCLLGVPWTKAEKRTLRRVYPKGGVDAAADALPGRTRPAIWKMAARLGMRGHRMFSGKWTPEQVATLKSLWGWEPVHSIARTLDRPLASVAYKASGLGLSMKTLPEGYEYVRSAAERTGFDYTALLSILALSHVKPRPHWGRTRITPGKKGANRRHIVESDAVDRAVARWMKTETVEEAHHRTGLSTARLMKILTAAKVPIARIAIVGAKRRRDSKGERAAALRSIIDQRLEAGAPNARLLRKAKRALSRPRQHLLDAVVRQWVEVGTLHEHTRRTRLLRLFLEAKRAVARSRWGCQHRRVEIARVDAAVAAWRATLGDYETTESACRRHGISVNCMRLWLAKHGIKLSRKERTAVAVFDRVVAAEKARPGCQAVDPRRPWTGAEIGILQSTYEQGVEVACAALPGRTRRGIMAMARQMGCRIGGPRTRWSVEELAKLREVYPLGIVVAITAFPNRTPESVRKKALTLGLHRTQQQAAA